MKTLKDSINESRKVVNEAAMPPQLRKLKVDVEEVEIDGEGQGWAIGGAWDYNSKQGENTFDELLKELLKVFKKVDISGTIVDKPVSMDDAWDYAQANGEEPEGDMYFVLEPKSDTPTIYSEFLLRF